MDSRLRFITHRRQMDTRVHPHRLDLTMATQRRHPTRPSIPIDLQSMVFPLQGNPCLMESDHHMEHTCSLRASRPVLHTHSTVHAAALSHPSQLNCRRSVVRSMEVQARTSRTQRLRSSSHRSLSHKHHRRLPPRLSSLAHRLGMLGRRVRAASLGRLMRAKEWGPRPLVQVARVRAQA